mmetsp:Transcript_15528/g.35537  ORF Transcript_15528/g.35537 Transcript_15528/m.35537 type:complete len:163 (+) Transcript_15528:705-1193(+)
MMEFQETMEHGDQEGFKVLLVLLVRRDLREYEETKETLDLLVALVQQVRRERRVLEDRRGLPSESADLQETRDPKDSLDPRVLRVIEDHLATSVLTDRTDPREVLDLEEVVENPEGDVTVSPPPTALSPRLSMPAGCAEETKANVRRYGLRAQLMLSETLTT